MWLNFDIAPSQIACISAPTLVMAGDQDMFPVSHTVEIWTSIPGAQLCIAPNASHFWLQEQPDLANQIILRFLFSHQPQVAG
jgi:pimeloyl-ACP methyl ester carboxylesterase